MATEDRKSTRDAEGSIIKKIEERRTSNGKTKKVYVFYSRVRENEYDEAGKFVRAHELKRRADGYQDALILRRRLRVEIKAKIKAIREEKTIKRIHFFDLLDFYEKHYVKAAVYSGSTKVSGQRSPIYQTRQKIKAFREFFGNVPVTSIDYARIFEFKLSLAMEQYKVVRKAAVPKKDPSEKQQYVYLEEWRDRKPATVHRYLACLRRILYVGVQQGFCSINPFTMGDPLIQASIEETRHRICTVEEEERLLESCVPPRAHMKNVIICAIDTFARENELFSLIGSDVDFEKRVVTIRANNAKTLEERSVPLSDRALEAFADLKGDLSAAEWERRRIFPFLRVKKAWYTLLSKAEIDGLRFHDLRGTGITRMLEAGIPAPVVMKFSGHKKYETFMKYVKKDLRMIREAGEAMSAHYRKLVENAKGQRPLSKGREESELDHSEITDAGDGVN